MQVNIKVHSVYKPYFSNLNLTADLSSFMELQRYLATMQPNFIQYIRNQKQIGIEEGFTYLDSNLEEISGDNAYVKRFKDGETIYIAPSIIGGGGKRGALLGLLAVAAFFMLPVLATSLAGVGATGGGLGAAATAVKGLGIGAKASLAAIEASSFLSTITANVGLALISAIFAKPQDTSDSNSRNNDMFGGLKNSTTSGTPVPLHYGNVRIAGQLASGYVKTISHDKGTIIRVEDIVNYSQPTSYLANGLSETLGNYTPQSTLWDEKIVDLYQYAGKTVRLVFKTYASVPGYNPTKIDSITLDGNVYTFDAGNEGFETNATAGLPSTSYKDITWTSITNSSSEGFYTSTSGTAQSGATYLVAASSVAENERMRWLRSPEVTLGDTPTLNFFVSLVLSAQNITPLNLYLDVIS